MPTYIEPPLSVERISGRRQAWREAGWSGLLPLVLMHGIGSNSRAWAGQIAAFSPERRVVAWNAPGYAESDPLPGDAPVPADYAVALLALLDALGIGRYILVGQSLGAIMATAAALRAPERIAALALASPASGYAVPAGGRLPDKVIGRIEDVERFGPAGLADRRAHRLLTDGASPQALAIVHGAMAEVVPHGYAQASHMLGHADLPAMVAGLAAPTLILWGGADIITPPAGCACVADAVPRASRLEIPDLGHGFATESPDLFNAALRPLIAQADAAPLE